MAVIAAAGIAAGASILGGFMGAQGARQQNAANKRAADLKVINDRINYQHRYQWTMSDMKSAGLNPLLAYKQGATSLPGAATYQAQNAGALLGQGVAEAGGRAAASAMAVKRQKAEIELMNANRHKAINEAAESAERAGMAGSQRMLNEATKRLRMQDYEINKPDASSAKSTLRYRETPIGEKMRILRELRKDLFGRGAR